MEFRDAKESSSYDKRFKHKRSVSANQRWLIGLTVAVILSIVLGFLIGWFTRDKRARDDDVLCLGSNVPAKIISNGESDISQKIRDGISAVNIKQYLRRFTAYPHNEGTAGGTQMAEEVYQEWLSQGLDHVTKNVYDVLLSYPDLGDPNSVQIIHTTSNTAVFTSAERELALEPELNNPNIGLPYSAYAAPGTVTGKLVYANYGTVQDFQTLQERGIKVEGNIVIARFGNGFRGDKVVLSELYGAIGVILYSDPADYTVPGYPTYPHSWYLPETGVQRGTLFEDSGDPLTPSFPSKPYSYRLPESQANLPKIPVQPISYGDALHFLRELGGDEAPSDWQGGLNLTYRFGPGFRNNTLTTRLHVATRNYRANTTDVFAFISGSVEPDQYVILGNHRDAWVFGGTDPNSGTAVMVELTRVLSSLVKQGWRPRRTLVFCSWGSEEFGLVGSTEWVEEFVHILQHRAVAYLNVDYSVGGNDSIWADTMPLLSDLLFDVAKMIETPNTPHQSMYDEWAWVFPEKDASGVYTGSGLPNLGVINGASDYLAFSAFAGIPSVDFWYEYDWFTKYPQIQNYPLYHTAYESFNLVNSFMDIDLKHSAAIGKFWGELTRRLADSYIIPMNVSAYPVALLVLANQLKTDFGVNLTSNGVILDDLFQAIDAFRSAAQNFQNRLAKSNLNNPLEIRSYNEQIIKLERAFITPTGLPSRPWYKHIVFAPSATNGYGGSNFPGLVDLLNPVTPPSDPVQQGVLIKQHFATIVFSIYSATNVLKSPVAFC